VDQLLPPVPSRCGLRWLQDVRRGPGAIRRNLTEHYSQTKSLLVSYSDQAMGCSKPRARPRKAGDMDSQPCLDRVTATPAALTALARLREQRGAVILYQSGGCCDGSLPICFDQADLIIGDGDVLLGSVGECPVLHRRSPSTRRPSTPGSSSTSAWENRRAFPCRRS